MVELYALTKIGLSRMLSKPRFYIALAISLCGVILAFRDVQAFLIAYEMEIQFLEPFIFFTANSGAHLILLISFLLLLGDAPFLHEGLETVFIRTDRGRWLTAQILVMVFAILLWLMFLLLFGAMILLPHISIQNDWSLFMRTACRLRTGAYSMGVGLGLQCSVDMLYDFKPLGMTLTCVGYSLLLFLYYGIWSTALNVVTKRSYGSILIVTFYVLEKILGFKWQHLGYYLSPADLVDLTTNSVAPARVAYTVLFFVVQYFLLGILTVHIFKKRDVTKLR